MRPFHLTNSVLIILILCIASLGLHLFLLTRLNIVEDESGYMQDAAQISWNVLPFREFGGTKGPIFLFTLKLWQIIFGQSLESSRMFSVVAHLASIPLLYLFARNITASQLIGYITALLWGTVPVVVGLTTNVMHIPLELLFIFGAAVLLTQSQPWRYGFVIGAATLFFAALLTRATAGAFGPLLLLLLILQTRSWKACVVFGSVCAAWVLATIAIIYPLYGWPKTAFFFNADAILISGKQRAVYAAAESSSGLLESWFRAALPAWREGLPLMLTALFVPFLWLAQRFHRLVGIGGWGIVVGLLSHLIIDDINSWWTYEPFPLQWIMGYGALWGFAIISLIITLVANKLPPISGKLLVILGIWVSGFILFYKGWGRSPTPFYILESLPAFSIAAGALFGSIITRRMLMVSLIGIFLASITTTYLGMTRQQYRGTIGVAAAKEMTQHIRAQVPPEEALFTAQPVFAYLSEHALYGRYTHPGWYLSERAGYLPASIRGVFMPAFADLATAVQQEVNWIVVDWRTNDVYFNESVAATAPFRHMLANDFTPVVTVANPASRDITLYRRTTLK